MPGTETPETDVDARPERMSDQRRAFLEYKKRVAAHGKPFFPYGVWHDVIAAAGAMAIIILLSVMWFAMANCDSLFNVSCDRVSTPLEQEHYTPDDPGTVVKDDKGEVSEEVDGPILGLLYEEKADPSTTSYHPRPEWYFYFLFYLLIVFSNPQLVVLGTIIVPTIWLTMLLAWPFIDRKKERRPSRRPIAMAAMVLTAITLLAFTYLGSQQGREEGGPEGITPEQQELAGYQVLFEDPGAFETCQSCHQLGGVGSGGPGPNLDEVGARYDSIDELTEVMANGIGAGMPAKGGTAITDEQAAQVAAFLATLGNPDRIGEAGDYGQSDWDRVTGGGDGGAGGGEESDSSDDSSTELDGEGANDGSEQSAPEGTEGGAVDETDSEDSTGGTTLDGTQGESPDA